MTSSPGAVRKILLVTSGSGSLVERCLPFQFFRRALDCVVADRECGALGVARTHGIEAVSIRETDRTEWSNSLLRLARQRRADAILSYSNLRVLEGELLGVYENRIFNSHFSLLPAFKGFYQSGEERRRLPATAIFERTLAYGSRVTGNTIHVVDRSVDGGPPVLVGTLNIPYDTDPSVLRHRLFVIECQTILQLVDWIAKDRLRVNDAGQLEVTQARFEKPGFSPNLDNPEIAEFDLPL